eukprot:7069602-Prymnesium_polylepis.1
MAQRPARGPPCVAPGCRKAPERSNTQHTYVPAEKGAEAPSSAPASASPPAVFAHVRAEAKSAGRKRKAEAPAFGNVDMSG